MRRTNTKVKLLSLKRSRTKSTLSLPTLQGTLVVVHLSETLSLSLLPYPLLSLSLPPSIKWESRMTSVWLGVGGRSHWKASLWKTSHHWSALLTGVELSASTPDRGRDVIHRGPASFWCMIHVPVSAIIPANGLLMGWLLLAFPKRLHSALDLFVISARGLPNLLCLALSPTYDSQYTR